MMTNAKDHFARARELAQGSRPDRIRSTLDDLVGVQQRMSRFVPAPVAAPEPEISQEAARDLLAACEAVLAAVGNKRATWDAFAEVQKAVTRATHKPERGR